jgi:hypothetical protein
MFQEIPQNCICLASPACATKEYFKDRARYEGRLPVLRFPDRG